MTNPSDRLLEKYDKELVRMDWYVGALRLLPPSKITMNIGICGKQKTICKLSSDYLSPLFIHDIIISKDDCEEGRRCYSFDCPLNKTTEADVLKLFGQKKSKSNFKRIPKLKKLVNNLNKSLPNLMSRYPFTEESSGIYFEEPVFVMKPRKKEAPK